MKEIKDIIEAKNGSGATIVCLEVNPPRGVEVEQTFLRLQEVIQYIDFFDVTDSALARMRFAALPFAALLKQRFAIEPLVNVSCRDRNVLALQADLLAAWATGVRSVVALTGDAMTVGDNPERKGVFEVNSVGLLNIVAKLNSGFDLANNKLDGATNYAPGVVLNPNVKNPAVEIRRLEKKKAAGALYALSQPGFDLQQLSDFFAQAKLVGTPLFLGLLPWRSSKTAISMSKIPGIKVSETLLAKIADIPEDQQADFSLSFCLEIAEKCRPHVAGFHIISGSSPKLAMRLAKEIAGVFKRSS